MKYSLRYCRHFHCPRADGAELISNEWWLWANAGGSRGRAPGQASDCALRAPNPLDSSAMTRCFIKISGPQTSPDPRYSPPLPPPPYSRRPCFGPRAVIRTGGPQAVKQTYDFWNTLKSLYTQKFPQKFIIGFIAYCWTNISTRFKLIISTSFKIYWSQ